ncbi:hypothetical protein [Methanolobus sp. ZRKC5]|uniref:hypothetical protein n=1 Tax=unclassified Methanolobus TaxID=2629569 RepID=UPI00313E52E2
MNFYLVTSGLLLIGLSLLHIVFGERNYFTSKEKRYIAGYVPYHQMSIVLLFQGLGLIYSAFYFNFQLPLFILSLIIGNLFAFLIICTKEKQIGMIRTSVPQFILFGITITLIVLGLY